MIIRTEPFEGQEGTIKAAAGGRLAGLHKAQKYPGTRARRNGGEKVQSTERTRC